MSAFAAALTRMATPCAGTPRPIPTAARRSLIVICALMTGTVWSRGQATAGNGAASLTDVERTVAYVSEVPWQWNGEQGNPLEKWARKLSSEWAVAPGAEDERLSTLRPELSWQRLGITALNKKGGVFVVHAYELIENGDAAMLDALLVPVTGGKASMTEFVILRQRRPRAAGDERKWSMDDLWNKKILVDRGGCGELVYRWLDCEIRQKSGAKRREDHAEFRSAASPAGAVLAVYFGEVDACVISRTSYSEVQRSNPAGLAAKLEEVSTSPPLLQHVIACPRGMTAKRRSEIVRATTGVHLRQPEGICGLAVPKSEDFKNLRLLITDWQSKFGDAKENPSQKTPIPAAPAAPVRPTTANSERRTP